MQNRILQRLDDRVEQAFNLLPTDRKLQANYLRHEADALRHEFGPGNLHNYLSWQNLYLVRLERETEEMTTPPSIVKQAGLHLALFIAAVVVLSSAGWMPAPLASPLMVVLFNLVVILLIINGAVNFYQTKRAVWRARKIKNWLEQNPGEKSESEMWEADTILI